MYMSFLWLHSSQFIEKLLCFTPGIDPADKALLDKVTENERNRESNDLVLHRQTGATSGKSALVWPPITAAREGKRGDSQHYIYIIMSEDKVHTNRPSSSCKY
jgi:hypothetical protein